VQLQDSCLVLEAPLDVIIGVHELTKGFLVTVTPDDSLDRSVVVIMDSIELFHVDPVACAISRGGLF
jgi:hypothetical protein